MGPAWDAAIPVWGAAWGASFCVEGCWSTNRFDCRFDCMCGMSWSGPCARSCLRSVESRRIRVVHSVEMLHTMQCGAGGISVEITPGNRPHHLQ